jgi:hypothetical protein
MNETPTELFDIKIDETGIYYIRKLFRLTVIIYIILSLLTAYYLLSEIIVIVERSGMNVSDRLSFFRVKILPFLYLASTLGNFIGVYYYVRFYRSLFKSINRHDQAGFNRSFKYAFRNSIVFIGVMLISLITSTLELMNAFMK